MITRFHISRLDCADCAAKIETHLRKVPRFRNVTLNFATMTLTVETEQPELVRSEVKKVEPDVDIVPLSQSSAAVREEHEYSHAKEMVILVLAGVLFASLFVFEKYLQARQLSYLYYVLIFSAYLLAGWNVLRAAVRNLLHGSLFDENFLMVIATGGAIGMHAYTEAVAVMIFYKIGELLQNMALAGSRRSIRSLLAVRPSIAHVQREGKTADYSPEEVAVGETVLVKPGERIPLDGIIIQGSSRLDRSALTGEPIPVGADPGSTVLAGEINLSSLISVRVQRLFAQSSIARILELVESASTRKARTERFITAIARFYTPVVVSAAVLIAFLIPFITPEQDYRKWIYRALVLLVISCPCALVISIPLGFFGGIGGASRKGVLVKGSNYLELLAKVKTVVFDKTGTLTKGVFTVQSIHPANGYTELQLLSFTLIAEQNSNHPIAESIRCAAAQRHIQGDTGPVKSHTEHHGMGVTAAYNDTVIGVGSTSLMQMLGVSFSAPEESGTMIHTAIDTTYAGYIVIGDEIKPEARSAIANLRKAGVTEIIMLTGDNAGAAGQVAQALGLDGFRAGLLPEQKVEQFENILNSRREKGVTVFVGDGINDAPVLARADIGIAMGTLGSDAAIETADVVLAGDSPEHVVQAIGVGRKTMAIVWQNIGIALSIKLLFIVLGALGAASMWEAVFADMGTAVLAILNASRALK